MDINKKLKIALLVDQPHWTGIGVYAVNLYNLIKDYIDVELIYLGAHYDDLSQYKKLNYIKHTKILYLIPKILRYNYKMFSKDENYKDYIIHYLGAYYPVNLIKENVIITVHDLVKDDYFLSLKNGPLEFSRSILRNRNLNRFKYILKNNPFIIAISNKTARDINKINKTSKIKVIYHHIDKERFKPREKSNAKKLLGLEENINYLLSVGSSRPNKRLDLIKIFAESLPEEWILIKIGESIKSEKILNFKNVNIEKYPLFFNASEAYLHMSDDEGFGIPLLEALGSGIPIIARNTEINKEILENYPIYLEEDTKKYYQKNMNDILQMIKAPSFKINELDKLLTKYDINNARKAYLDFYNYVYNEIKDQFQ
ncbi:MAG: glycosyltransferase [Thermoplasmata archaeon]